MPEVAVTGMLMFIVVLGLGMAAGLTGGSRTALRKRAVLLKGGKRRSGRRRNAETATVSVKRDDGSTLPVLEAIAGHFLPRQAALRDRIARAGLRLSIGRYLAICLSVATIAAAGVILGAHLNPVTAAPVALSAGIGLPHVVIGLLGGRRRKRFLALLPDAIDLIVRGLKSGLPVTESIGIVGRELPDPIGSEFRQISDGIRFGRRLNEVMWEAAQRLQTAEFNFLVITLSIQQETGGNLAETLANLGDILRRRKQMRLKIKAMSSEAKASAFILGSLPVVMFGVLYSMNPQYESLLLDDPRGQLLFGCAIAALLLCAAVMAKMVRFEI